MTEHSGCVSDGNRILTALPADERARLMDSLEEVTLSFGQVIYDPGELPAFAYFPTSCIVSLLFTTRGGATAELALIGRDGLVGIPLILGGHTSTHRAMVRSAGMAWRLRTEMLSWELGRHTHLQQLALCHAQALMTQMAQNVVCNRHHTVDQQLCRWLLMSLDQRSDNKLDVTHELIASMLGVRREAVTEAAGKLQATGLIRYRRGHITVTNRPGLEARVCECYGVVRTELERLSHLQEVRSHGDRAPPSPKTLRMRAETRLQKRKKDEGMVTNAGWMQARLMHELEVHQIELEMTNESLRQAYDEADALCRRYADLYDFAPIPYFTLDEHGVIIECNLAGAILLNIQRSQTRPHRFAAFLKPECLPAFNRFLKEKLGGRCRRGCELVLLATPHHPEQTIRIQAVTDETGHECRLAVIDTVAREHIEHDNRRHTDNGYQTPGTQ